MTAMKDIYIDKVVVHMGVGGRAASGWSRRRIS